MSDSIRIAKVAHAGKSGEQFLYSPDKKHVALVVDAPNLETNRVDSTLRVYVVSDLQAFNERGEHPEPVLKIEVSSSSSVPGFRDLAWTTQGSSLLFIEIGELASQLMKWSVGSRDTVRIPVQDVVGYEDLGDGRIALFSSPRDSRNRNSTADIVMTGRSLPSAFRSSVELSPFSPAQLSVLNLRDLSVRESSSVGIPYLGVQLSPDGNHISYAEPMDVEWTGNCWRSTSASALSDSPAAQVALLNLKTGMITRPFGGPIANTVLLIWGTPPPFVSWTRDGAAIAPFTFTRNDECRAESSQMVAGAGSYFFSVDVDSWQVVRTYALNSDGEVDYFPEAASWARSGQEVLLTLAAAGGPFIRGKVPPTPPEPIAVYKRARGQWQHVENRRRPAVRTERAPALLEVREHYDQPPALFALGKSGGGRQLQDLAPFARDKILVRTSNIEWADAAGRRWKGLLAVPDRRRVAERLPLILQTHGHDEGAFFAEGPATSPFPGRAALSRGFAVLTVYDLQNTVAVEGDRPNEPARFVEAYRAAIESLATQGIIDPSRVGAIGWSRTSYYVKYALTNAPELFAVAVVADGVDYGYGQYLLSVDWGSRDTQQIKATYGGVPWTHWEAWQRNAPGFNVDKVAAPVRIEATSGLSALIYEWEFYAGLRRLNKPVDLVAYPGGEHALINPAQRLKSTEGTLDWFDFWLNNHTDPAATKKDQYARWSSMRAAEAR